MASQRTIARVGNWQPDHPLPHQEQPYRVLLDVGDNVSECLEGCVYAEFLSGGYRQAVSPGDSGI